MAGHQNISAIVSQDVGLINLHSEGSVLAWLARPHSSSPTRLTVAVSQPILKIKVNWLCKIVSTSCARSYHTAVLVYVPLCID